MIDGNSKYKTVKSYKSKLLSLSFISDRIVKLLSTENWSDANIELGNLMTEVNKLQCLIQGNREPTE